MTTAQTQKEYLTAQELKLLNDFWRAGNYLSIGQIYLKDNPLLKEPLQLSHIKPRLLGHWGTTPGLNFLYTHLNRLIKKFDLNMIFVTGPGHGGPGLVAMSYLEGTYTQTYPHITQDELGLKRLFTQFSYPGGIPSHVAPETPGSIHEGGELGYSLLHAYGAVLDNPDLVAACVIGDGEAETGPLATSWHSNKFINPDRDGIVLPILHLNGYKIANPTVLARMDDNELTQLFTGYGYKVYFVTGSDPTSMHNLMAQTLDKIVEDIKIIKSKANKQAKNGFIERQAYPMIIFRSPKGWTCPQFIDGIAIENTHRSHQVPLSELATKPEHIKILENWLKSYKFDELIDADGKIIQPLLDLPPKADKRMSANPHTNGGLLLKELELPDLRNYECTFDNKGQTEAESTRILGKYLKEVFVLNDVNKNFRLFGPDETASNRLGNVFETTGKVFMDKILPTDDYLSQNGRVMEVLSEHMCQGWLEGYLLTGRHGFFSCYEAFIHIIDSMFNQHAKWLKVTKELAWRRPIASLNYLLSSHVWRQDHNGFSHQDPGFIDHAVNKKAEIIRVYLPPDANTLLCVANHCLASKNKINIIVAGKQPQLQWLTMEEAYKHCNAGLGIWEFASNDDNQDPDVVMACAGDVPTLETLAAVDILRKNLDDIKIRVVNVVDLMTLQPASEHPHGLSDFEFDSVFTADKPVIFAYHGYPWLIHRLTYRRKNHANIHVRGYKEEGTTTTPFDMVVLNDLDRFHLAKDVIERVGRLRTKAARLMQLLHYKLIEHKDYIVKHGDDMPEIKNWRWTL